MSNPITRHAREQAFPGATQWDADLLNPWKNEKAGAWNAEGRSEVWNEAFLAASKLETEQQKELADESSN